MITMTYSGAIANLQLLAEEISDNPLLKAHCTTLVTPREVNDHSLNHGQFADIVISIAAGVATNAIYDGIRTLVDRARNRGDVDSAEQVGQES
ncbi:MULTISPECIES: hypothetical protein [unclassified Streptomyces]|uniref:hypothetical protein n=1 Tax=unclassified Streptomyces TaxID=2593676 RepID=UPI002E185DE3